MSQSTTDAPREIQSLIDKSADQVGRCVDLVDQAGLALHSILDRISHISSLVSNIAKETSEQATGLAEANASIAQLDQVT